MKKFDDFTQVYNTFDANNISQQISGISYYPDFSIYKNYYKMHVILPEEEYRPDKIAFNLWGDQTMSWVLSAINNFYSGIREYKNGVTIFYVEKDVLRALGIL
jgi:hypothetical protein